MKRHVILLVEDDPDSATATSELLESYGYEVRHAGSFEEARPVLDDGRICLALLDLNMKAKPGSAEPRIDIGLSVLEYARRTYPGRSAGDKNLLQIVMMSGHATEVPIAMRCTQEGANDFIRKGLDDKDIRDKLRNALRHSGRGEHEECAALMQRARKAGTTSLPATQRIRLSILGAERKKKRTAIEIAGKAVELPAASLGVLLLLAKKRVESGEGWVSGKEHGANEEGWKPASRLRKEIETQAGLKSDAIIQNNGLGNYRLHPDVELADVDWPRLAKHSDPQIQRLAAAR